jgi:nondiscriminating glutamyl-tRNA synthetase
MNTRPVRVRFAPSPTGFMHLGNVRAALMNYLFARQHNGTFILRIEDTDPQRNVDPGAHSIMSDLEWLELTFDEGPIVGGPWVPYFQSQRHGLYQEYLNRLQVSGHVYPCFCTFEELERKRERQIALKQPPRYDRACLKLSESERERKHQENIPYIWRFKIPDGTVEIQDMARGIITYDFKHFSDFALTRPDNSFTFIFANFVDDLVMEVTHIIRGEDHLTNTANQAALYKVFHRDIPIFWHLPIICNHEGKKLSKRDFGFSLQDLRDDGFIAEAVSNYLAIIGASFAQEIMSLDELTQTVRFEALAATGQIKYDLEKLRWLNHKWVSKLDPVVLAQRALPFLLKAYPAAASIPLDQLVDMVKLLQADLVTLKDIQKTLQFYFEQPILNYLELKAEYPDVTAVLPTLGAAIRNFTDSSEEIVEAINSFPKAQALSAKKFFSVIRLALIGQPQGPRIKDIISILGTEESILRLELLWNPIKQEHEPL